MPEGLRDLSLAGLQTLTLEGLQTLPLDGTATPDPVQPSGLSLSASGSTAITLTFNGGTSDTYTVEYRAGTGSWLTHSTTVTTPSGNTTITIPSLTPSTAYTARVANNLTPTTYATSSTVTTDASTPSGCLWTPETVAQLLNDVATIKTTLAAIQTAISSLNNPTVADIQANLAKTTDVTAARDAILTQGNAGWKTAAGFAVPGDAMTLTTAYDAAKTAAPTADAISSEVWDAVSRSLTTPFPDVPSATDNANAVITAFGSNVEYNMLLSDVTKMVSQFPQSGVLATVGDAMNLTTAYDSAKTAASAASLADLAATVTTIKAKTDLIAGTPATVEDLPPPADLTPVQNQIEALSSLVTQSVVAKLPATGTVPNTETPMTLAATYDRAKNAASADEVAAAADASALAITTHGGAGPWTTASASPGVTVEQLQAELAALQAHGDETWLTASGFVTPENLLASQAAIIAHGDDYWTGGGSGGNVPTAEEIAERVWLYPDRTLTGSNPDGWTRTLYCTREDVNERWGKENVDDWADFSRNENEAQIAKYISAAIRRACIRIDGDLATQIYRIPFDPVPDAVRMQAAAVAGWELFRMNQQAAQEGANNIMDAENEYKAWITSVRSGIPILGALTRDGNIVSG